MDYGGLIVLVPFDAWVSDVARCADVVYFRPMLVSDSDRTSSGSASATKNKFVHLALQRTLALATELRSAGTLQNSLSHGLDITIAGDNDFYSQRAQVSRYLHQTSMKHECSPTLHSFQRRTFHRPWSRWRNSLRSTRPASGFRMCTRRVWGRPQH